MGLRSLTPLEAAADLAGFDAIIDARSPAEFAEDHLPGAINWPVLDDEQRRVVGTLYVQTSALEARKLGAAMVARNIADHLDRWIADKSRDWQPLVYCWRGGQRSGSLAWFLDQIGFRTAKLAGGYKGFRAVVRQDLDVWPARFHFRGPMPSSWAAARRWSMRFIAPRNSLASAFCTIPKCSILKCRMASRRKRSFPIMAFLSVYASRR